MRFLNTFNTLKPHARGVTLVEILASITLFSLAVVAIYIGTQMANQAIGESMKTDIEAAIANIKMAEVNPYKIDVESFYDKTAVATSPITIPNNGGTTPGWKKIYWTRIVDSCPRPDCPTTHTSDIKRITVYLYKNSTDTVPYRKFKKEVDLRRQNFLLTNPSERPAPSYRDSNGQIWITVSSGGDFRSTTGGSVQGIRTNNAEALSCYQAAITGASDIFPFQSSHCAINNAPGANYYYIVPVSQNATYKVTLGFATPGTTGTTIQDIIINGVTKETLNVTAAAGGYRTALTRTYPAITPMANGSIYTVEINVDRNGGTTDPLLNFISVERE